jgi:tRNA-binding EMAP/Myf-like protein
MSEFHVRVVKIGPVEKHPNADSLSVTQIDGGYPVVFKTGTYKEGDLAIYLPIDSIVPDQPYYEFLASTQKDRLPGDPVPEKYRRIKAKKLRGVFSMGMLVPVSELPLHNDSSPPTEGQDVQQLMGVTKWEPDNCELQALPREKKAPSWYEAIPWWRRPLTTYFWRRLYWRVKRGDADKPLAGPAEFHEYTDLEGLRKFKHVLEPGEEVWITEKIHGANGRFGWFEGKFWVGSHHRFLRKPQSGHNWWWDAAIAADLERKMKAAPGIGFYGEVYGCTQKGFGYDVGSEKVGVRFFDAKNLKTGRYLDRFELAALLSDLELEAVPLLYRGPWSKELLKLAEGTSNLNGKHVREGFVVTPAQERFHSSLGRVILKMVGEGYHLARAA